ncbi:MAG: hypothetical protein ACLGI2_09580 [Acidimicrobiia bacterium]
MKERAGRRAGALMLAATGALLVACGVPVDDDARRIPDRDVPFDLLEAGPPTTPVP